MKTLTSNNNSFLLSKAFILHSLDLGFVSLVFAGYVMGGSFILYLTGKSIFLNSLYVDSACKTFYVANKSFFSGLTYYYRSFFIPYPAGRVIVPQDCSLPLDQVETFFS